MEPLLCGIALKKSYTVQLGTILRGRGGERWGGGVEKEKERCGRGGTEEDGREERDWRENSDGGYSIHATGNLTMNKPGVCSELRLFLLAILSA